MSDQLFNQVSAGMDPFKKILSKIPGFSGYMERQARRDSDKLLRDTLADRIEQQWQRISSLQRDFIKHGEISLVGDAEGAAIKLRTFADRVRHASRGYSGLFDAVKINEAELARLYQYDAAMLDLVDEISQAIDTVETSMGSDGLPAALRHLEAQSQKCIDTFDQRESAILGSPQS
jgi:hypothetical protein